MENFHTILERSKIHFVQKSSFGRTNLLSNSQHFNFFLDFNKTFVNFGGNLQSMEETNLRGVHTSGSWGNNHFNIGDSTNFSGSTSFVSVDNWFKIEHRAVGENQTEFSNHLFSKTFQFGHGFTKLIEKIKIFSVLIQRISSHVQSFLKNSVLTNN